MSLAVSLRASPHSRLLGENAESSRRNLVTSDPLRANDGANAGNPNILVPVRCSILLLQDGWVSACEDLNRQGSRQRRNNATLVHTAAFRGPRGLPEAVSRSCALEGVGSMSGRKLIYR